MINKFLYFWVFITFTIILQMMYIFYDSINIIYLRMYEIIFTLIILFSSFLFFKFQQKLITKVSNISQTNEVYLTKFRTDNFLQLYTKHTLYGFYLYYKDPINMFFLLVSFSQILLYQDFRSLVPLVIFSILALLQYMSEITHSINQQTRINDQLCIKIDSNNFSLIPIKQKDLRRGDYIRITYGQHIPADILLIGTQRVVVNELDLTGENIDIHKKSLPLNSVICQHFTHQNKGTILYDNKELEYNSTNIIFRNTKIIDCGLEGVTGIVIEVGNDCQIFRLDYDNRVKITKVEEKISKMCLYNLLLLLILTILCGTIILHKQNNQNIIQTTISIILLFNTMIPLSLQFFYNTASTIISKRLEKEFGIQINNSRAFQNKPYFIVSDKTGTLTSNKIELHEIWHNNKNITNMENNLIEKIFRNILSCTNIDIHSQTRALLKTDILEELLVKHMEKFGCKLCSNNHYQIGSENFLLQRESYQNLLKEKGHKIAILCNEIHIQGTPEYIGSLLSDSSEFFNCLEKIEAEQSYDSYKRIICHTMKNKDEEFFQEWSIYVFYDYLHNIDISNIQDLTILTGDKKSTALQVGKSIGMKNILLISGSELETIDKTKLILNKHKIIYRASPDLKQKYVTMLKETFGKPVLMVGDGSNDISAIMTADLGIGIIGGENQTILKISDMNIHNWSIIPKLLQEFELKTLIVENICHWVMIKHILTSFTLFGMLINSYYQRIRDPTSPFLMSSINGILFLYMTYYCSTENNPVKLKINYYKNVIIGIMNGFYVFTAITDNSGIYLALSLILMYLIYLLQKIHSNKNIFMYLISTIILLGIFSFSKIDIEIFFSYLLFSSMWLINL